MRNASLQLIAAVGLFVIASASSLEAQYAVTQDSTLRGLQKVLVNFIDYEGKVGPETSAQVYNSLTLELRKAGIRIARDSTDLNLAQDGILNVALIATPGFSTSLTVRMDLEQHAQLARTKQTLRMVTWYHEDAKSGAPKALAGPLMLDATNKFLSSWLAANGR
jgi:hypothetical protein